MIDPLADLDLGMDLDEPAAAPAPAPVAAPTVHAESAHEEDLASSLDFDLDAFDAPTPAASGHAGPVESALADLGAAHNELDDLSFGEESLTEHTGSALPSMSESDLDLDLPALEAEAPVATPAVAAPTDDLGLDFSFDLNDGAAEPADSGAAATHELDTTFGELSSGTDTGADFGADDPVQTKIDLARAYIDMGDIEGAREILNEADAEGSAQQKQEIRGLLNGL